MKSLNEIRTHFVDYFQKNNHKHVKSSSLIPVDDDSILFINAGMNQFKNIFTGTETRDYSRAVSAQKCVRAGGKHNDLENVGKTSRHHTFFEMLGNFSFGDYFKEEAIFYSWQFVNKELGINKDKLWVTIYHDDDEAYEYWKKIAGFSDERIIRIATSDNFWQMGSTGPCGPCSEIFYDHGDKIWGGLPGTKEEDGDRFVEIWNIVFMQYDMQEDGSLLPLPKPSIDTGMGIERVSAVMQGVHDNYDIDLFKQLIATSAELSKTSTSGEHNISHRIIADHIRAMSFLIADGILPSNEGRGYVLRRIMRRAMRQVHMLGVNKPMIYQMVPELINLMGSTYGELNEHQELISQTILDEETRFISTLDKGLKLLDNNISHLNKGDVLDGDMAFKLYDTYGFPLDLTEDVLKDKGISVDKDGFSAAMEKQRQEARKNWTGSFDDSNKEVWFNILQANGATNFLGYEQESANATLLALVDENLQELTEVQAGDIAYAVFDKTPFYAESGGQIADIGTISKDGNILAEVLDVQKYVDDLFCHKISVKQKLQTKNDYVLQIDEARRKDIMATHSSAHLLHKALKIVLGNHIAQKGSYIEANRLRFDISHNKALTTDEIKQVEQLVLQQVFANTKIDKQEMNIDEAKAKGAVALFGEKYKDNVRVISMGDDSWSIELCAGTHANYTGDVGCFHIISESSISAGVRRIEALTGMDAFNYLQKQEDIVKSIASDLSIAEGELQERVKAINVERKNLEKQLMQANKKLALLGDGASSTKEEVEQINGHKFVGKVVGEIPPKELKSMAEELLKNLKADIVALASQNDGKGSIVVAVAKEKTDSIDAVQLVRVASSVIGGKGGGGRPDMAQAGGPDGTKVHDAIKEIAANI